MQWMNMPARLEGDLEIMAVRIFDAPRELVWSVWSDPKHIGQWWGPVGFTTTTHSMDFRTGGVWRFVMHGPDGRDYQNKVTYTEVVKPERLAYRQEDPEGVRDPEPIHFQALVTFEEQQGKTRLTMRMTFPTEQARRLVVENYGAVQGLDDTLGRLTGHIAGQSTDAA